ncbi:MAG: type VII secretion protein EssC [Lachnospiraceae bacterium]|nr:type VII secretion protein EssC [Lachnospiraceae bacterium]
MILMIYDTGIYKEYRLPNLMDADYQITLESRFFHVNKDIQLSLEVESKGWKIKTGPGYQVEREEKQIESSFLRDGDVYNLIIHQYGTIQMVVLDIEAVFPVLEKIDLHDAEELKVGRNQDNDITYQFMDFISKYHAVFQRTGGQWYVEDISTNGVFFQGKRLTGRKLLQLGDQIHIFGLHFVYLGDLMAVGVSYGTMELKERIRLWDIPRHEAVESDIRYEKHYYNRSPRNIPDIHRGEIVIDTVPAKKNMKQKPAFLVIGPAFTMAVPMLLGCLMMILAAKSTGRSASLFMFTGLVTAAGSAVLGVFWGIMNLRYSKSQATEEEQQRFNAYGNYLVSTAKRVKKEYEENQSALNQMYPDAAACVQYGYSSELWNRNITHSDFLYERLGQGDMPFQVQIKTTPKKFTLYEDVLEEKPYEIEEEYRILHQVPVGVDLLKHRFVGLIGGPKRKGAIELMHILTAQIAANNCYTDVKLVFIYERDRCNASDWECMKWFPHVWSQGHKTRYIAADKTESSDLFYELSAIFRRREEETGVTDKNIRIKPHYIVFVSDPVLLEGELIRKYIYNPKEKYGLTAFLLADRLEELPNECEMIVQKDQNRQEYYHTQKGNEVRKQIVFDQVSPEMLEGMGRMLSGIEVNEVEENTDIPNSMDFFEMYGVKNPDELQVANRWKKNRTYNSMRALVGKKAGEQECYLDVHEKYHGPHGLIAGTTGSGKSEMLQSYILSLAINYSPDDVGFFLIDFKGGGMAELFDQLPHLVGKISNLSGNQVRRAMISIKSENHRRQRIFREYGVNNINLYTRLYKNHESSIPIPHLFIVIDEFAELKKEQPDFMRELISVAQVGRSLGVHLILATQKPGGTVDDNIWSNSKFRICLRVQDKQDSVDMLHKPDAAFLTQAGRCYLQVGNDEIYEQFQSGYSGAVYEEESSGNGQSVRMLTRTGKAAVIGKQRRKKNTNFAVSVKEKSQLNVTIDYLKQVALQHGYGRPMELWLPVLPKNLICDEIVQLAIPPYKKTQEQGFSLHTIVGLCDDPVNQAQHPLVVDFAAYGHYAVCGAVVSGKSTFLQTLVYRLLSDYTAEQINLYILDFSSRLLAPFLEAPQVGGIIFENEEDRIGKFFYMMRSLIEERKEILRGGNYSQFVRAYGTKLPAIMIVIDNIANFREKTGSIYDDELLKISREGVGYGIYLLISSAGFGLTEIPNRIGDNIRNVICLEMGDKYKYMDALHTTRIPILPEADVKGRGIVYHDGALLEFQTGLSLEAEDDFERCRKLESFSKELRTVYEGADARKIPEIPEHPQLSDIENRLEYQQALEREDLLPFAFRREDASIYSIPLYGTYCYTVLGSARTGKKNTLKILLEAALKKTGEVCVMEFSSRTFAKISREHEVEYLSTPEELFTFLQKLTPVFVERNHTKRQLLEQGMEEEEIYRMMEKKYTPIFIFLTDVADFFKTVYAKNTGLGSMYGFVENIIEKGSLHHIYFIGALDVADTAGNSHKAYLDFIGYKKGICLGKAAGQRIFNFTDLSFTQQNQSMKKGTGIVWEEEDGKSQYLVIPQVRR